MSVVNKMLQDLEARQANGIGVSADYLPPLKGSKKWWYVVLLLIVLGLFGLWLFTSSLSPLQQYAKESVVAIELNAVKAQKATPKTMLVTETPEPSVPVAKMIEQNVTQEAQTQVAQVMPTSMMPFKEQEGLPSTDLSEADNTSSASDKAPELARSTSALIQEGSFQMKDSNQANQMAGTKQQIKEALADNNSALAIKLLDQLLAHEPDNIEAIKKLATLLFANGNVLKSTNLLQSSVQRAPQRGDFRLMLARLYVQQNRSTDALSVLQEIQPAHYMEIDYLAYRANVAQQLADFTVAKQDYTVLTQVDGNNARWWLGLAITEEKLGAGKTALNSYYQAQNLAQLDPAVTEFIKQRISVLAGVE
jgi:MSHA biogenesis protein MshN